MRIAEEEEEGEGKNPPRVSWNLESCSLSFPLSSEMAVSKSSHTTPHHLIHHTSLYIHTNHIAHEYAAVTQYQYPPVFHLFLFHDSIPNLLEQTSIPSPLSLASRLTIIVLRISQFLKSSLLSLYRETKKNPHVHSPRVTSLLRFKSFLSYATYLLPAFQIHTCPSFLTSLKFHH